MKIPTSWFFLTVAFGPICIAQTTAEVQTRAREANKWSVSGRVLNRVTGVSVSKARVAALPQSATTGEGESEAATTDAEGRFLITGEGAGAYRLVAERAGYLKTEYGSKRAGRNGVALRLGPGQEIKDIEIHLTPPAALGGRAFDEDGEPAEGLIVMVLTHHTRRGVKEWMPARVEKTNDRGEYRASGLQPGKYIVATPSRNHIRSVVGNRASANEPAQTYGAVFYPNGREIDEAQVIDLPAGADLPGIDLHLKKTRVFHAKGRVLPPGGARGSSHGFIGIASPVLPGRTSSRLAEDGSFELRDLQPGTYHLLTLLESEGTQLFARTTIEVSDKHIEDLILSPAPALKITGKVILPKQDEQILPQLIVGLESVSMSPLSATQSAKVQADGSFTMPNTPPGRYRMVAVSSDKRAYLKAAEFNGTEALDKDLDLTTDSTLTLTLATDSGTLEGMVTNQDEPAVGSSIAVVPSSARRVLPHYYRFSTADNTGRFRIEGIVPGEYKVFAFDDVDVNDCYEPEFIARVEQKGVRLTVSSRGSATLNLEVIPLN